MRLTLLIEVLDWLQGFRREWSIAQRAVWPDGVVVDLPLLNQDFSFLQCVEDFSVKQLVA
jgi:hypothetical protein